MNSGPRSGYVSEVATYGPESEFGWDLDSCGAGCGNGCNVDTHGLYPDVGQMWSLLGQDPDMVWMRAFVDQDPETDLM